MICHLIQVASLFKSISTLWLKCGVQQTNAPFWEVICVPRISIWYLPTHLQTHKLPNIKLIDSTFMYFCWGGSTAINANIRLVRCFIVMLPSARIDRNGCPIHIMHRRSISNGPRIGAAANISSLWEQGARGCNGVECRRWLSECAKMVIKVCKHVLVKNPDDLLSLFQDNHATLGQFFSAINSKAKKSILLENEHLDGRDRNVFDIFIRHLQYCFKPITSSNILSGLNGWNLEMLRREGGGDQLPGIWLLTRTGRKNSIPKIRKQERNEKKKVEEKPR